MSAVLPSGFAALEQRLALGLRPLDAVSGRLAGGLVRVEIERFLPHAGVGRRAPYCEPQVPGRRPRMLCRHPSGRYALIYQPGLTDTINLRLHDQVRRYVPRRLSVPLLTEAEVIARETAGTGADLNRRARAPVLFPAAAYPVYPRDTGLRGRVLRDGAPMRWALVEAIVPGSDPEQVIARTRTDDRGECLLLLPAEAADIAELPSAVTLRIEISGPPAAPVPADPDLPGRDPLWDLPLEQLADDSDPDPVADGTAVPAGWQRSAAAREVTFPLGRLLTEADEPAFVYT